MARAPTTVPAPKGRFPYVRGTWPPQPDPIPAQAKAAAPKPVKSTRDYGKIAQDALKEGNYGP